MSMGLVSQLGEDLSSVCKILVVSVAGGWLSLSMEIIGMAMWLSSCVQVLELMIAAPFLFVMNKMLRTMLNQHQRFTVRFFVLESVSLC